MRYFAVMRAVQAWALGALLLWLCALLPAWQLLRLQQSYRLQLRRYAVDTQHPALLYFTDAADDVLRRQIVWLEPHEFRYQGHMYDIVDSQRTNGRMHYTALPDAAEEQLRSSMQQVGADYVRTLWAGLNYLPSGFTRPILQQHCSSRIATYAMPCYAAPPLAPTSPPPQG